MRKSISNRILFILVLLTFLFILNTVLSGVTNSQVKLSADLMSESFVKLQGAQLNLEKEKGVIESSIQSYVLGGENKNKETAEMIMKQVEQANIEISTIVSITDEFTVKAMNEVLQEAYQPYYKDSKALVQQATTVAEQIHKGDLPAVKENYSVLESLSEAMTVSENEFQLTLDRQIEHENLLIKSRVTRSTIIVWSMAAVFIVSFVFYFLRFFISFFE